MVHAEVKVKSLVGHNDRVALRGTMSELNSPSRVINVFRCQGCPH